MLAQLCPAVLLLIIITDRTSRLRASFYRNSHHAAETEDSFQESDADSEKGSDAGSVGLPAEAIYEYEFQSPPRTPFKRQDNRPSPKTGSQEQELTKLRDQVEQLQQLLLSQQQLLQSQQQTQQAQAAKEKQFCVIQ